MERIGKICDIPRERDFEWRIEDFTSLPADEDEFYKSPSFSFAGESWYLKIYPNGTKNDKSTGYIELYLFRESSGISIDIAYSLVLKTMDKQIYRKGAYLGGFKGANLGYGFRKFLKRSKYLARKSESELPDVLSVICSMKHVENTNDANKTTETANCSFCGKELDSSNISFHESKCLDKPIKCPDCSDVVKLNDWNDHECPKTKTEHLEKLSHDLKEMMLNKSNNDVIVKVKGEEFQLHRNILMARNSYFNSMFTNDMKEKNTGIVAIDDCKPDIFHIFVTFIYTGKVDEMSPENVCELYETTDKYQEDQLKKDCLDFMMKTITEDSFCDYIVLALKYDEKELFEKSIEFLVSKPKEIVCSVKWQNFVKEFPTQANELFIKTLNHHIK